MKRFILFAFVLLFMQSAVVRADEGMWLPYMLSKQTLQNMQKAGCKLTAEEIFSFNKSSVKDAIVQFGSGCTGEIISNEGLLLTNHHCGLAQIQEQSSVQHDYLTNGFWSKSKAEELPNPGLTVSFLTEVRDVTDKITKHLNDKMTYAQRKKMADSISTQLEKEEAKGKGNFVRVKVTPIYNENQYLLFVYQVYKDVRLVATPPWGIGKFGADTDNWTWPRHKGDFCMFRVYTAPDGSPADYSKDNVPMKPKHFLPISVKGVEEGDYAMIMGYPGGTDRYCSSQNVEMIINESGPAIIKCRTEKLDVYRKHMDANQEVFIKYASKQAGVSNYWKYSIGQVKQLQRNKVVPQKQALEKQFAEWVNADAKRKAEYGNVLSDFAKSYAVLSKYEKALVYHREAGLRGGEAVAFASMYGSIINLKDTAQIKKGLQSRKSDIEKYFKDYDYSTDEEVTTVLLTSFYKDIAADMQPSEIAKVGATGDFKKYVKDMLAKSVFSSKERFDKWMENPYDLSADPVMVLMLDIYNSYANLQKATVEATATSKNANRLYLKGVMEMQKGRDFYPDANSTMRLTYGNVQGYKPSNGVHYDFYTTLDGVMEKEIPGNWEFDVPAKLKALFEKKDYGQYANKKGELVVNFITTNDITGGNSGSPVLDKDGNLIGLAFDGNWEAMSGDISFDAKTKRTICMDARYLLFIIDKMENAQNIMNELKILK